MRSALGAGRRRIVAARHRERAAAVSAGSSVRSGLVRRRRLPRLRAPRTPRLDEISLNRTAIVGAVAITAVVTLRFALVPALITSRVELQDALRSGSASEWGQPAISVGPNRVAVRRTVSLFVAAVVLSAAGVIARSLTKLNVRLALSLRIC